MLRNIDTGILRFRAVFVVLSDGSLSDTKPAKAYVSRKSKITKHGTTPQNILRFQLPDPHRQTPRYSYRGSPWQCWGQNPLAQASVRARKAQGFPDPGAETHNQDHICSKMTYFSKTTPRTSSTSPPSPRPVIRARASAALRSDSAASTMSMSSAASGSMP